MDKVIKDKKGFLDYLNKTTEGKVFNTYKIGDYKGNNTYWKEWEIEMEKREETSCYDFEELFEEEYLCESKASKEEKYARELIK